MGNLIRRIALIALMGVVAVFMSCSSDDDDDSSSSSGGGSVSSKIQGYSVTGDRDSIFNGKTFTDKNGDYTYTVSNGEFTATSNYRDNGASVDSRDIVYDYALSDDSSELVMKVEKKAVPVSYKKDETSNAYKTSYELMTYDEEGSFLGSSRWESYERAVLKEELKEDYMREIYIKEYFPNTLTDEDKTKITDSQIIEEYIKVEEEAASARRRSGDAAIDYNKIYTYKITKSEASITLTGECDSNLTLQNMKFTGKFKSLDYNCVFYISAQGELGYSNCTRDKKYDYSVPSGDIKDGTFDFIDESGNRKSASYTISKEGGVKVIITYGTLSYTLTFEPREVILTKKSN